MPVPTIAPWPLCRAEANLLSQRQVKKKHRHRGRVQRLKSPIQVVKEVSEVSAEILHKPDSAVSTAVAARASQTQGTKIEGEKQQ